jgi:hypothetical protein
MRAGEAFSLIARPAVSGTMRARRTKKEQRSVTARQWIAYIAVAALTTWATQKLYDQVDAHLGASNGRVSSN